MNPQFWKGMLIACLVLLLVLVASVLFTESDSATSVVTVLAAAHLLVAMAIISAFIHFEWDPFEPFRNR